MPLHLRELPKGTRFMLLRTRDKYTYLGIGPSPYSGILNHLCKREFGNGKVTTLHHSCHVKPIVRLTN